MTRSTGQFPTSDDPGARYAAVVERGRHLRRRDRRRRALVTTGVAACVLLVVVAAFAVARPEPDTAEPATTAAPPAPVTATLRDGTLVIRVRATHLPATAAAKVCADVRVQPTGPAQIATAAVTRCWSPPEGDAPTVDTVPLTNGVEIGCEAVIEVGGTTVVGDTDPEHEFELAMPADMPAGRYTAEVTGVAGTGDGCPTSSPDDGDEIVGKVNVAVDVP